MKRILWIVTVAAVLASAAGYGWDRFFTYFQREQQLAKAKKVEARLAADVSLERIAGENCRVWDVLRHIGAQTDVPLWWDEGTLSLHGDGRTELVAVPGLKLPLKTALELILSQTGAVYYVDHGRIVISAEPLREKYVVEAYPLPSLVGGNPARENRVDDWMDAIKLTTGEHTWDQSGGGTIEPIPGGLVIHQTESVHRQIREILDQLQPAPPLAFREALAAADSEERRLEAALDAPCDCEFAETPFYETVQALASRHQIPLAICRKKLDEQGIQWLTPVSLSLKDISLRSALRILADQAGCCCVLRNGTVQITTPYDASSRVYPKVYDVRDLVHYAKGDLIYFEELLDLVLTMVSPDNWHDGTGPGPIATLDPGWIIISQREEMHREIAELLATVRLGLKPGSTGKDRRITLPQSPVHQKIEAALRQKIIIDYSEIPLDEVAREISVLSGLNVVLDVRGLEEAAIHPDQPVTCHLPPLPLRDALDRLVDDAQPEPLDWFVRDECLIITTRVEGQAAQSLLVLDVRDILGGEPTPGRLDVDGLTDRVRDCIEPSSWDATGGSGSIQIFRSLLLARSTRRINERVAKYLQGL